MEIATEVKEQDHQLPSSEVLQKQRWYTKCVNVWKPIIRPCLPFSTFLMVGFLRGYIAFLLPILKNPESKIPINDSEASTLTVLSILGCVAGSLISGLLSEIIGRKKGTVIIFLPFSISWILWLQSKSVQLLYTASIFGGVASGMSFMSGTYVAEVSTTKLRPIYLACLGPSFSSGLVMSNGFVKAWGYEIVAYVALAYCVIMSVILCLALPESPYWLVKKSRTEEARQALTQLRKGGEEVVNSEVQMLEDYMKSLPNFDTFGSYVRALWSVRAQFYICCTLAILQQMAGYTAFLSYSPLYFQKSRLAYSPSTLALIYSAFFFVGSMIMPFSSSVFTNKSALMVSAMGSSASMAATSVYHYMFEHLDETQKPYQFLVPAFLCSFIVSCGFGIMSMNYIMASELLPPQVKGMANGIYGAFTYAVIAIVLKLFPLYLRTRGIVVTCALFAVFCCLHLVYAILFLPETTGKTFSSIQEEYFPPKAKSMFPPQANSDVPYNVKGTGNYLKKLEDIHEDVIRPV